MANKKANLNSIKHAAHSWMSTRLYKCQSRCVHFERCPLADKQEDCPMVDKYLSEKRRLIESQPHVDPERDGFLIERTLRLLFGLTLMEWYVFDNSDNIFDENGNLTPALGKYYITWNNALMRCLTELGMTPVSAMQFKSAGYPLDIATRVQMLRQRKEAEKDGDN